MEYEISILHVLDYKLDYLTAYCLIQRLKIMGLIFEDEAISKSYFFILDFVEGQLNTLNESNKEKLKPKSPQQAKLKLLEDSFNSCLSRSKNSGTSVSPEKDGNKEKKEKKEMCIENWNLNKLNLQFKTDNIAKDKHNISKQNEFVSKIKEEDEGGSNDFGSDKDDFDSCSSLSGIDENHNGQIYSIKVSNNTLTDETAYNYLSQNNYELIFPLFTKLNSQGRLRLEALYNLIDSILLNVMFKQFIVRFTIDEIAFSVIFVAKKLIYGLNYDDYFIKQGSDEEKLNFITKNSNFLLQYIFDIPVNPDCCSLIQNFVLENKNKVFKCFNQYMN